MTAPILDREHFDLDGDGLAFMSPGRAGTALYTVPLAVQFFVLWDAVSGEVLGHGGQDAITAALADLESRQVPFSMASIPVSGLTQDMVELLNLALVDPRYTGLFCMEVDRSRPFQDKSTDGPAPAALGLTA